ncbi:uncharacterized protein LOC127121955 [Lathyrus oleraceus]|uniref:uncharacterized protein LOC127121955 n=1 Tax=Pisum sativum TaxID=3888 RepID=UPI0021D1AA88|nr:uncharacterized protein LOC127121955 [Pisum sativum]
MRKVVWDILVHCYEVDASMKKVKLQSLHKQYENLNMKDNEKIPDYISRVILITNEMKSYGETLFEQVIIEKERKSEEANIVGGESDDEPVLLMASESDGGYLVDWWYMHTGCSNHLTGNKQWLINFDSRKRTKIRCVNDKYLNAKGMRNVKVRVKNGKNFLIKDVWYVPGIKSNLMSVGKQQNIQGASKNAQDSSRESGVPGSREEVFEVTVALTRLPVFPDTARVRGRKKEVKIVG